MYSQSHIYDIGIPVIYSYCLGSERFMAGIIKSPLSSKYNKSRGASFASGRSIETQYGSQPARGAWFTSGLPNAILVSCDY